jgi:hypothetical protein
MPRVHQVRNALRCAIDSMSTRKYSVLTAWNERLGNWETAGLNCKSHVVFQQSRSFDLGVNRNLRTGMQASSN